MSTARSIPAAIYTRSRCSTLKRPPVATISVEKLNAVRPPRRYTVCHFGAGPCNFNPLTKRTLDRLRAGDSSVQEHFCGYFTQLIQIKLRSRLKSPQAIEDIRQETFARFFVALREGRILKPECVGSYVNTTCNYVLNEHYRGDIRHSSLDDDEDKLNSRPRGRAHSRSLCRKNKPKRKFAKSWRGFLNVSEGAARGFSRGT